MHAILVSPGPGVSSARLTDGWKSPGVTGRLDPFLRGRSHSGLAKGLWFSDFKRLFFFFTSLRFFSPKYSDKEVSSKIGSKHTQET